MPRQASVSVENNFSKGLITEATGLNFPENACTETYDCIFDKTGEVFRRSGIHVGESLEATAADTLSFSAITEFLWKSVGLTGERTFFVLQIGRFINFWEIDGEGLVAPGQKDFYIDLAGYVRPGAPGLSHINVSFAAGNGQLFIAHPWCTTVFVEYDADEDTITQNPVDIKIRDVEGVRNGPDGTDDRYPVDLRPSILTGNILYNLINQGWGGNRYLLTDRLSWGFGDAISAWRRGATIHPDPYFWYGVQGRNDWPSEADFPAFYKRATVPRVDDDGNLVDPMQPDEAFSILALDQDKIGSSPAPKGRFIYDAFHIDRWPNVTSDSVWLNNGNSGVWHIPSGLIPPEVETSNYARPSQVAFFAGRAWYAGVDSPKYATRLYFSQILEGNKHVNECYQRNDPTAEGPSVDLLPSDGGIVVIPEAARIIKLVPFGTALLVFCTNGIWQIAGASQGSGFNATDYGVHKLTEVGSISALNFVIADGTPLWWNSDGIYSLKQEGPNAPVAISLTNGTIQAFYDEIPVLNRRYVKGAYNRLSKIVQWVYRQAEIEDNGQNNSQDRFKYDRVLNLDLNTGAFYPWTIPDACAYVAGITVIEGFGAAHSDELVTDVGETVTDGGEDVTVPGLSLTDLVPRFKYIVFNECGDVGGTPDTEPTLTYNRNFLGNTTAADYVGAPLFDAQVGSILKGEDGEYYVPTLILNTSRRAGLQRFDGSGVLVERDLSLFASELAAATGLTLSSGAASALNFLAFPFTQYFLATTWASVGSGYYACYGLYKINSSGAIEYMNSWRAYRCHFVIAFSQGSGNGHPGAVGFEQFDTAVGDRNLLALFTASASSSWSYIFRIPSINTFLSGSFREDGVSAYPSIWTGYQGTLGDVENYNTYNPESSQICFFLPVAGGTSKLYRYADYATVQRHIDFPGAGLSSPFILANASTYPNGFMMSTPITAPAWSVANNSFRALGGGPLVPFADVTLDRDGSVPATNEQYNDWSAPGHSFSGTTHYLVWTRKYRPAVANQTDIGSYRSVILQTWNPASELATEIVTGISGNPYDTVAELDGSAGRYGSYPRLSYSFLDPANNGIYMYSVYDASSAITGQTQALAKFGDFVPGVEGTPPTSVLAFAEFTNSDNYDWANLTVGYDYDSYFISGYKVHGEAIRKWQSNYWQVYTRNDFASVFDVYGRWDYAISGNTGRWNSTQRVTQDGVDLYQYKTKRLKMRGHGKTLQFKVNSVEREPFNIIGWTMLETANAAP